MDQFITVNDAANMLAVSRRCIYRYIEEGTIQAVRFARGEKRGIVRITQKSVNDFIAKSSCKQQTKK